MKPAGIMLASDDGSWDGSELHRYIEYVPAYRKLRVVEDRGEWLYPTAHTDGAVERLAKALCCDPMEVWRTVCATATEHADKIR